MVWYLTNIALTLLSRLSLFERKAKLDTKKAVCIIGAVNWILLSGLRHLSVGADTYAYKYLFNDAARQSWSSTFEQLRLRLTLANTTKDPGYTIAVKLFQCVSDDYRLWLVLIACVFIIPMAIWIYKYSSDPCMSFIVFSTLFYSFFAITGLRQTIATAIAFFGGMRLIEKKRPILFLLTILFASLIHASSITLLPLYFLDKIKISKIVLSVYWFLIVFVFVFRDSVFNILKLFSGYGAYVKSEMASGGAFMLLIIAMAAVYTVFYKQIGISNSAQLNMASNSLFMACIFTPLLLVNESCMRIVQYYSIFIMILLPEYKHIFKKDSQTVFSAIVCAAMILLLIRNHPTYHFFWESV